ncbi:PH domain-containing protein [Luethyella okanaganae]|uniref:PH domain-containing protein n=1 Tax=Luethyella okanaganae TaxID=69372 RepID=A0ABW1VGZ3_9MICO
MSLTDGAWHRLHPATPLLKGGLFIVAIAGFVIANLRERLIELFLGVPDIGGNPLDEIYRRGVVGWALLGVLAVLVVILVAFYFSWRMHSFRVTSEAVEVRSGILFRTHRKARLDRIQGVNVNRPLIPRLFGAARIEVSVAGQDANVQLSYLTSSLTDDLRRDILRLASRVRQVERSGQVEHIDLGVPGDGELRDAAAALPDGTVASNGAAVPIVGGIAASFGAIVTQRANAFLAPELDPDAAPPESVVTIPAGRLIGSIVCSGFTVAVFALAIAFPIGLANGQYWILFTFLPALIGGISFYFNRFTKGLRYSIAGTSDGVRVGFGLLSTSNETLPPGRIHAIAVAQPLLWRPFGWWHIRINTAGHSSQKSQARDNTTVLPVGRLADVEKVLELILPGFGADEPVALIETGMLSRGEDDDGFTNAPRRAAWLRPFSWRRTGFTIAGETVLFRRGVITRDLILVPLARLQSVGLEQGPIQRMLRLATTRLHTVTGPIAASLDILDSRDAVRLFDRIAVDAIASAGTDTSHHWRSM